MNSEMFLKLLVTQLQNQDPSSPMDTNEMMAQTTQLAMMESLTNISDTFSEQFGLSMRATAASLLGENATYKDKDGVEHSGLVTAVSYEAGVPTVTIDGVKVNLDAVSGLTTS